MQRHIFDPSDGSGSSLVASFGESERWVHEVYLNDQEEREQALRERSMRELGFGSRSSYCG